VIGASGGVSYGLLAGGKGFRGEPSSDPLAAIWKTEPDWAALPADPPPCIRELARRCLTKDPKQRLQAIGDARIAIEEAVSGEPALPRVPRSTPSSIAIRASPIAKIGRAHV